MGFLLSLRAIYGDRYLPFTVSRQSTYDCR
jgi:hypothetical protein